jgi:hypothetical protein
MKAVVFDLIWNKHTVNSNDVCSAGKFAKAHDIDLQYIKVDLQQCLDHELPRIAQEYYCISPQIGTHIYCIEELVKTQSCENVIMGPEVPIMPVENGVVITPGYRHPKLKHLQGKNNARFPRFLLPFLIASENLGVNIVRDPLCMSPEIMYLAHAHNATVFEERRICYDGGDPLRKHSTPFKEAYYDLLLAGTMPPLLKRTGFETLKYHLAAHTGVYNEFDKRYRDNMEQLLRKTNIRMLMSAPRVHGDIQQVIERCQAAYDLVKPTACNIYDFDW